MVRYGLGPAASDLNLVDFDQDGIDDVIAIIGTPPANLSRRLVVVRGLGVTAAVDDFPSAPIGKLQLVVEPNRSQRTSR